MKNTENPRCKSKGTRLSKIVKIEKFRRWWKEKNFMQMAKDNKVSTSLAITLPIIIGALALTPPHQEILIAGGIGLTEEAIFGTIWDSIKSWITKTSDRRSLTNEETRKMLLSLESAEYDAFVKELSLKVDINSPETKKFLVNVLKDALESKEFVEFFSDDEGKEILKELGHELEELKETLDEMWKSLSKEHRQISKKIDEMGEKILSALEKGKSITLPEISQWMTVIQWEKCDIRNEAAIHSWLEEKLRKDTSEEAIIIKDHGAGEIADFIVIEPNEKKRQITFYYCKATKGLTPGDRKTDAYEILSQAILSEQWIKSLALMEELYRRTQPLRNSSVLKGDKETLEALSKNFMCNEWKYKVVAVQPGFSYDKIAERQRTMPLFSTAYEKLAECEVEFAVWGSQ